MEFVLLFPHLINRVLPELYLQEPHVLHLAVEISYDEHFVKCSEVTLHVMTAGDASSDKAIILLHGFPEFWYGWKAVGDRLVKAGYYVVIPDQRGYNKSDHPFWVGNYKLNHLAQDIADLIAWTGRDKVYLAGHDWGAAVAWAVVSVYPDLIHKVIIVNVPHTRAFAKHLRSNFSQLRKSWYMFFFQLPLIPQFVMWLFNFKLLRRSLTRSSREGTFSDEDLQRYTKAWGHGINTMIHWYRASMQRSANIWYDPIELPVLIIWGKDDKFLEAEMAEKSLNYCNNGRVEYLDATHWVLHEEPEQVSQLITAFIDEQ